MPKVHRLGDQNSAGGVVTDIPQGSVFANDRLVVVTGSIGTGHDPFIPPHEHGEWITVSSSTVFVEDIMVGKEGDSDSCGHPRVAGSDNVEIM